MQLFADIYFMQVPQWLGHAHRSLTLDTCGDWIPSEDVGALNNLLEPAPAPASAVSESSNVIQLFAP
ncbi:hypothetical protein [Gordonia jacobaea]|uniref:hypothetical protein n=1 Tax=Gordonia jacobaea TaxID=122202 RepID=UPI003D72DAF8